MYLDMMQTIVGNSSKVLVDQKQGSSSLLYLPLDKLIQQSAPAAGPSATGDPSAARQSTPPPAEPSVQLDPSRSREALRARERGTEAR
jgi:membrane protease subunit HflK